MKKSLRILVIEDSPIEGALLQGTIEQMGHTCLLSTSGEEGLNRFLECSKHSHIPDMVILDIHLPAMDGCQICEILRGKTSHRRGHYLSYQGWILSTSSDASQATIHAMVRAGCDDFLAKPFSPRDIATRILLAYEKLARKELLPY